MNCDRSTLFASQASETSVIRVAHLPESNANGSAVTSRVITYRTVPDASAYCVASWFVGQVDGTGPWPSAFRNAGIFRLFSARHRCRAPGGGAAAAPFDPHLPTQKPPFAPSTPATGRGL